MSENESFYSKQTEPNRSCFFALRTIILNSPESISETKKYGMPCFVYNKRPLLYLWKEKVTSQPYVLFVDGLLLNHPDLESGDRAKMKVLKIDPEADLDITLINELLSEAIQLRKA